MQKSYVEHVMRSGYVRAQTPVLDMDGGTNTTSALALYLPLGSYNFLETISCQPFPFPWCQRNSESHF